MLSSNFCRETLTVVLAGGNGERLFPLTRDRAKPAVPFAGQYRLIDFTLSNCVNSGLRQIYVLTQYMSNSLDMHLNLAWNFFTAGFGEFLLSVHPQFKTRDSWYLGTADAVFQNIHLLTERRPKRILILSGDHIYRMNYAEMISAHVQSGAAVTIAAVECDLISARRMGVLESDSENRVVGFQEKPENPAATYHRPDRALVNMGVYVFETGSLIDALYEDALCNSAHDFGKDILPRFVQARQACVYPFYDARRKRYHYWRDIGTLDSYYEASMDLVAHRPPFRLADYELPLHSHSEVRPPARFTSASRMRARSPITGHNSLICNGCVIRGRIERSVLSPDVSVNPGAHIEESVLFDGVHVGSHAKIRRAIIDKEVRIPPGLRVGYDLAEDRRRFTVTESGVVIIPKREVIELTDAALTRPRPFRGSKEIRIA